MKRLFMNKKNIVLILFVSAAIFTGGCKLAGILAAGPTKQYILPEYDLKPDLKEKIYIFVSQPAWIDTPVNIRQDIADKMKAYIKVSFKKDYVPENILTYEDAPFADTNSADLDPSGAAEKLGAKKMFYIEIQGLDIIRLSHQFGYYSAEMKIGALYYDITKDKKLWPAGSEYKVLKYDIECEKGAEKLGSRLATANAHCILRHFYKCKKNKFKIAEEAVDTDFSDW
ncbi:hypothetical protein SMSP1_00418 [Sedimentisphaera salicampi]|nr:hypothetical protein SMSP1_00418 [Sedimentisphaera salicampi]